MASIVLESLQSAVSEGAGVAAQNVERGLGGTFASDRRVWRSWTDEALILLPPQ